MDGGPEREAGAHGAGSGEASESAEALPTALERLKRIRGVSFEWRDGFQPGARKRELGVIAQEVQAVFPDAVTEHESGYLMVDYNGLVAALIEAVKELAARVEELERRG